jgi:DNA-binding GntR family transcriptional regulator
MPRLPPAPARRPLAEILTPDSGPLLNDRAYETIRDAIATFQLAPGQAVSVGGLATWIGVSRTPIRDALQRLQHEGLVRSLPRRGMVVTQLTAASASELYEMQEALEAMAVRLAAVRATPDERARLKRLAGEMAGAEPTRWIDLDTELHAQLFEAARSPALRRAAQILAPQLLRFRALAALQRSNRPAHSAAEHATIVELIAQGAADEAALATHRHWEIVRAEALEHVEQHARMSALLGASPVLEGRPALAVRAPREPASPARPREPAPRGRPGEPARNRGKAGGRS